MQYNRQNFSGRRQKQESKTMSFIISRRNIMRSLGLAAGAVLFGACGGTVTSGTPTAPAPAAGSGGDVALLIGSKGATPYFENEALVAAAGSKITLTLKNNADAGSGKKYNWALVKPNTALKVVTIGQSEGDETTAYIKTGDENVIAYTRLAGPGETVTVSFDAPPPGVYPFICTFPGLYTTMKGTLTIK